MIRLVTVFLSSLAVVGAFAAAAHAQAPLGSEVVRAEPVKQKPVGHGRKLTVFVDYVKTDRRGKPAPAPSCAVDSDQPQPVPHFAQSPKGPVGFEINNVTLPTPEAYKGLEDGFTAWESQIPGSYFMLTANPLAPRGPAFDERNAVGWARLKSGAGIALAATWSWENEDGRLIESDIFFSTRHAWGYFTDCAVGGGRYEVGNIATHEIGHALGLDHLSDQGKNATLYPSAPLNEVLKRTPTTGDQAGLQRALSGP